jgi:hypothetical protein
MGRFFGILAPWVAVYLPEQVNFYLLVQVSVFPEKDLRALSPSFHMHVSVSDSNILSISPHIFLQQNRQAGCGIYKSLTDT